MTKHSLRTPRFDSIFLCLSLALLLIMLPCTALPQTPYAGQNSPGEVGRIRVNANLVVLHATVKDRRGMIVSGLNKDSFQVYEDGVLQQIKYFSHEDIPVTVGLVIDNSGSMGKKRAEVIAAALAFARSSNPQDQMFVVNFNEHVRFPLPAEVPFTGQVSQLEDALSRIITNGQTALYDAIWAAVEHLKKGDRNKQVLIVISDGGDNASKHSFAETMAMAHHADAIVYTIGLFDEEDDDRNPNVLKQLANDTGGGAFLPHTLKEAVPICEKIAHDIRNQYTIAYIPSNRNRDGTYRVIRVKASAPGERDLLVRTRAGYHASLDPRSVPAQKNEIPWTSSSAPRLTHPTQW
jgi:Ca-activated chloride channel family protein